MQCFSPHAYLSNLSDASRGHSGRGKDHRLHVRLSLAAKGAESHEVNTSADRDRLATPSSGGRMSFKGSGLPVPVGTTDGSKFRRMAADGQAKGKR